MRLDNSHAIPKHLCAQMHMIFLSLCVTAVAEVTDANHIIHWGQLNDYSFRLS
jgi:hypothetical protein